MLTGNMFLELTRQSEYNVLSIYNLKFKYTIYLVKLYSVRQYRDL